MEVVLIKKNKSYRYITPIIILALVVTVIFLPTKTRAAAAFVQYATGWSDNETFATTGTNGTAFGSNTTTGNSIICLIRGNNQASTISSVQDNNGGNFSVAVAKIDHTGGQRWLAVYYLHNITGRSGHTVTMTINAQAFDNEIVCHEVSGLSNVAPDVTSSDNTEAGTAVDCPAVTPSANGAYLFGAVTVTANTDTFIPDTSDNTWIEQGEVNGAVDSDAQAQYFIQTTAASITAEWTQSGTGGSMCAVAGFLASAGAADSSSKHKFVIKDVKMVIDGRKVIFQ